MFLESKGKEMAQVLSKEMERVLLLILSVVLISMSACDGNSIATTGGALSRHDFPPGFVFGAGTSAYQVEGAAAEGGRKPSIWDTFVHQGRNAGQGTGDIASDQYHKYKDDVRLMHKVGIDAYRFSISWSRLIPDGHGSVNPEGRDYYNNLIDELVSYGIEAHVTLNHFDFPQALEDEYEGILSPKFLEDFTAYADICFREYGDRVKSWMTFNEPSVLASCGYSGGTMPPGRCSYPFGVNCSKGDSTTEVYLAAHNLLLSHAAVVHLYKTKYQEKQRGQIGVTLHIFWFEPLTSSPLDVAATDRVLDFQFGWFLDPLVYGRYPEVMRKIVGSRLPHFTKNDSEQLKGSFDFVGLNYYLGAYVQDLPRILDKYGSDFARDISVKTSYIKADGSRITEGGLQRALNYVKQKYKNPAVVIHENGFSTRDDGSSSPATRNDTERIEYIHTYIQSLLPSIRNGSNVRGYFVWSFIDCFELIGGYSSHYGLYGVDFHENDRRRDPRQSAHWYSAFLAKTGNETRKSSYLYSE